MRRTVIYFLHQSIARAVFDLRYCDRLRLDIKLYCNIAGITGLPYVVARIDKRERYCIKSLIDRVKTHQRRIGGRTFAVVATLAAATIAAFASAAVSACSRRASARGCRRILRQIGVRYVHIIRQISYRRNISVRSIVRNCLPVLFPYCSLARIEVVVRNKRRNVDLLRHDPKKYGSVVVRGISY